MPFHKVEKIFLSATKRDCDDYRQALKVGVEASTPTAKIHLQEHWNHGAMNVVDLCAASFSAQDAYIGLFGFRHGWQPPGRFESITQLEFRWATARWERQRKPPVFILLPELGSAADHTLRRAAGRALRADFPNDKPQRKASWARQRAFVAEVRTWARERFLMSYCDRTDLLLRGTHAIKDWNVEVLERAGAGRRLAGGALTADELGRIGHDAQFDQLQLALRRLRRRTDALAAVFAVHGPEGHGQLQFAARLAAWEHWDDWDEIDIREPVPLDRSPDAVGFVRWVAARNQAPLEPGVTDPVAALAAALTERLRETDLVFVMSTLGSASDRWRRFVVEFWQPLQLALATRRRGDVVHRLLLFVVDHDDAPVHDHQLFWDDRLDAPAADTGRVLALPALRTFTADDIADWLDDFARRGGCRAPAAERRSIATAVTTPDSVPVKVYDRLQRRNLQDTD